MRRRESESREGEPKSGVLVAMRDEEMFENNEGSGWKKAVKISSKETEGEGKE